MSDLKNLEDRQFEGGANLSRGQRDGGDDTLAETLNKIAGKGNIDSIDSDPSAGGAASESLTFTGLKSDDEILAVSQVTKGSLGTAPIAISNQVAGGLDVEWTGDPGAGAVIRLLIRRGLQ